jgi:transcriptional regulator with XRE-family HTH domain
MTELVYRQVGAKVEQMRSVLGITQADFAKKIGMTRTSVTNIEAGRQRIQLHQLERIAAGFGCTPKHLLKGILVVT